MIGPQRVESIILRHRQRVRQNISSWQRRMGSISKGMGRCNTKYHGRGNQGLELARSGRFMLLYKTCLGFVESEQEQENFGEIFTFRSRGISLKYTRKYSNKWSECQEKRQGVGIGTKKLVSSRKELVAIGGGMGMRVGRQQTADDRLQKADRGRRSPEATHPQSANNNWNQVIRRSPAVTFAPNERFRTVNQAVVLGNYAGYDFEDQAAYTKSFSFRQTANICRKIC
jgi:hypothetical protein